MSFTIKEVESIAHLARIDLHDNFRESIANDLIQIVKMVEQIATVPTENIPAMAHPLANTKQRLRADEITESNNRSALLEIAPKTEAGLFLVPPVIEEA